MTVTCIWNGRTILGESPVWDFRQEILYWIDIDGACIHSLTAQAHHQVWPMPSPPGSIGLHEDGGLIVALRQGFAHAELTSGKIIPYAQPLADRKNLKFNDGKCDRQGHFWAGTADIEEARAIGSLYRLNQNGLAHTMDTGFTVSNGLGWSPDNKIMYFTDSPTRTIYQYDFDANTSTIKNRRVFAIISAKHGYPDGLAVDSQGYVWSAHWDGWRITRYTPNGKIERIIDMPVQRPTSCCFGGRDLNILYITSASKGLTEQELTKGALAGGVFALTTEFSGINEIPYRYKK